MKKYIVLVFVIFISTVVFSQNYQDVIFLKNGSIIRGVIIEQVPNVSIKIETADRNVFVYQMNEIEKLTKERRKGFRSNNNNDFDEYDEELGYKGIVGFGYAFGVGDWGMDRFKLQFINSWQLNPYFALGFGTGVHYYLDAEAALIPLFADFRSSFLPGKVSPYVSLGLGYSFDASDGFEGVGFLLNLTAGVNIKTSPKNSIHIGLGYEMQKMPFYYDSYYYYDEFTENSGAISLNFGFSF
jgi:hypothetical protein